MATWRLMGNLNVIRSDIQTHFSPDPVIGTLGDTLHAGTKSDHNPVDYGFGRVVAAIDVMYPVGANASAVVKACIGRPDLAYVIHNRTIWSADYDWKARRYTGDDPHTNHVHVSSKHTKAADLTRTRLNWVNTATPAPVFPGTPLKVGMQSDDVKKVQTRLKLTADGFFGPWTLTAVIAFQKDHGLIADGIVGRLTWTALFK